MTAPFPTPAVTPDIRAALTPGGVLRAGINLSNGLLVSGRTDNGEPDGVSPDMARAIAAALGVPCILVPYKTPGEVADAASRNEWDIGLIGAEPQRAATIAFTPAYAEIEACFAVRNNSPAHSMADLDRAGTRLATTARAAFTLWLERNIHHATLIPAESLDAARQIFVEGGADALASLKSKLVDEPLPDARVILPGFMTVQQAIGCARTHDPAVVAWLTACVHAACTSGFVAERIRLRGVRGLDAARPA